ncbi:(Fe-S)-binding protein [Syntrophus aciditrophicus]|uniref:Glutamate synthase [NADPH] small chain n=1 Tax=Syntrophus aciditrophicus (strain SB) TaxID=56780 RepID=Q2LXI6_SYNAS|nr:(Fe-S)-binding protein [Syntrophus aciditrophicus]ABC78792.1 glutamate synthase [NADPH] small chain [Syntrophus aciditrophicus SB]
MNSGKTGADPFAAREVGAALSEKIREISEGCARCGACRKECAFLRKYGTPGEIADAYDPVDDLSLSMVFECSLCRLCAAVCPAKLNPAEMFLEMRRERMRRDPRPFPEHRGLLAYEKTGNSKLFACYALPTGCDTVFFTGCALPGTRPEQTFQLYRKMQRAIPGLGVVMECCNKISHDLGRQVHFQAVFEKMRTCLVSRGVKKIIAACPNCYRMFDEYGRGLSVITAYEVLAEHAGSETLPGNQIIAVHDPCGLRFKEQAQAAVRRLVTRQGAQIEELRHSGRRTSCCGEGGGVRCLSPELAGHWGKEIREEAKGRRILTYCAGCANSLNGLTPTSHIVDFVCDPEATLAGRAKVSKPPVTYLNRLILKWRFRKAMDAHVIRNRGRVTV